MASAVYFFQQDSWDIPVLPCTPPFADATGTAAPRAAAALRASALAVAGLTGFLGASAAWPVADLAALPLLLLLLPTAPAAALVPFCLEVAVGA